MFETYFHDVILENNEKYSKPKDYKMTYGNTRVTLDSHETYNDNAFSEQQKKELGLVSREEC